MMNSVKTLGFIIIFYIGVASCKNTPIVFWHGMGDSCCNVYVQQFIDNTILKHIPGVYYFPIRIGGNTIDEMVNSYLGNTNKLIQLVCEMIQNDANLTNGYYAIGFSQGSQFLRAVGQRCSNPPMLKLITLAGQHQGVYGIPKCRTGLFCNIGAYAVSLLAYFTFTQKNFVQATYWHDPFNEEIYRKHNNFLADINQEQGFNPLYKKNMQRLKAFVMVKFVRDQMVNPHETSWFGFFKKGSFSEVYTMEESELYINDTLGLKTLDQQGKIFRLAIDGDHLEMSQSWFIKEIVLPFLKD